MPRMRLGERAMSTERERKLLGRGHEKCSAGSIRGHDEEVREKIHPPA